MALHIFILALPLVSILFLGLQECRFFGFYTSFPGLFLSLASLALIASMKRAWMACPACRIYPVYPAAYITLLLFILPIVFVFVLKIKFTIFISLLSSYFTSERKNSSWSSERDPIRTKIETTRIPPCILRLYYLPNLRAKVPRLLTAV